SPSMCPAGTLVSVIFVPPLLATSFHRVPPSSRATHSFATLALCSACRVAWVMLGLLCVRGNHTETVHQVALHSICRQGRGRAPASPPRPRAPPPGGRRRGGGAPPPPGPPPPPAAPRPGCTYGNARGRSFGPLERQALCAGTGVGARGGPGRWASQRPRA